jgi:hypothetical protein
MACKPVLVGHIDIFVRNAERTGRLDPPAKPSPIECAIVRGGLMVCGVARSTA